MKEEFGLYLILTNPVAGYKATARAAVDCGVRYLQLRMKDAPRSDVLATAKMVREVTCGTSTRFIVNDDLSVAMAHDADGIHLGQNDLSITEARTKWNQPGKIFGLSTHSKEQAVAAMEMKPNYIGIGPVFPTQTKADADPALGPAETGWMARALPITHVAIGGINAENLKEVLNAGVSNYGVASMVNDTWDPKHAIHDLQQIHGRTHKFGL